ncbi:MAG: ATP-binding protein [Sedimentisphaerales bacterium]|nr:ATP-binding protein [Sedimentisphaerales bacterium]MBN2841513.1 ATP-binding protein [Sedimentisphaerales bacterium]
MKPRYLQDEIHKLAFASNKICLVSGPRQSGKTSLGKILMEGRPVCRYFNWDDLEFRRIWAKTPLETLPVSPDRPLVVLDEIHKDRTWKRTLKGIYDVRNFEDSPCDIFVTGSARLNVYRRGSDSMLGRYYHFRLAPFSLRELVTASPMSPEEALKAIFQRDSVHQGKYTAELSALLEFGPFPEPLFAQDKRKWNLWHRQRHEMIVREDLRDLGASSDLGKIETLAALLPERASSPLSVNSLSTFIEVGHQTVKRWLGWLNELYFCFEVKPWQNKIKRSIKKEGKLYLWDYSELQEPGSRFENMIAVHLLKACNYWTDAGYGVFELYYLRNRDGREIDFLIVQDGKPWLPVEVKKGDTTPSDNWKTFLPNLQCQKALQITEKPNWKLYHQNGVDLLVAGADEVLIHLV